MRLWHQKLWDKLPIKQVLGQHRECCALRGKGWEKRHSTVQYALDSDPEKLILYADADLFYIIYKEHNDEYYQECIENLAQKGIFIDN